MWPFNKKKEITTKSNSLLTNEFSLSTLGSTIVQWSNVYKDTQNNKKLIGFYNNLAELAAPVNKYADGFSQILPIVKINGKAVTDNWVNKLLNKPNDFQNWNAFISQLAIYRVLLANVYITGNNTSDAITGNNKLTSLFNLPPQYVSIELENKEQKDLRLIKIKNYILNINGTTSKIEAEKVLHIKGTNPNFDNNQYLYGLSNFVATNKNIESIENGYSAKVNLYKHGARVFVTGKSQGDFASTNTSEDIETVQKRLNTKYGITDNQFQMLVTDVPLDVKVVGNKIQDLRIPENNRADFERICSVVDVPTVILSDNTHSSENNKEQEKQAFYNIPFKNLVEDVFADLTEYIQRFDKSITIEPDFSKISEIVKAQNEAFKEMFESVKIGMITRNKYLETIGKDIVNEKEFNEYYYYNNGWFPVNQINNESED